MGKRGPQPSESKTRHTGVRIPSDLRAQLEVEAAKAKRTLSEEILARLEAPFPAPQLSADVFDGPVNYAFFRLLAMTLFDLRARTDGKYWYESPLGYVYGRKAIEHIFDCFKPPNGKTTLGNPKLKDAEFGEQAAEGTMVWMELYSGDYGKQLQAMVDTPGKIAAAPGRLEQMEIFKEIAAQLLPLMQRSPAPRKYQLRRKVSK